MRPFSRSCLVAAHVAEVAIFANLIDGRMMMLSLCILSVLCASVVSDSLGKFTTETQSSQRSHRAELLRQTLRGLESAHAPQHRRYSPQENLDIERQRPGVDVHQIVRHPLIETAVTATIHLPETG